MYKKIQANMFQENQVIQIQQMNAETFFTTIEKIIDKKMLGFISTKSTSPADKSERYLTSKQVCELMQISNVCRHNYEKKGILKRVDFGGLPRYKLSDIEKQLDNRKK